MTEKQYEDLMFALSTIIGLLKSEILIPAYSGIDYETSKRMDRAKLERWAEEAYKDITGSLPNREEMHETLRKDNEEEKAKSEKMVNEVRDKEKAQEKKKEEEEEARQSELERIKNEELALAKRGEACRVTDIDHLREGATHENN